MGRFFTIILSFLAFQSILSGQQDWKSKKEAIQRLGVIYKSEKTYDLSLHSNGFYVGYNKGTIKTYYRTHFFHMDFGYIRHPKEQKQTKPYSNSGNPNTFFKYGKQNSLYNFRIGRGFTRYYSEKARRKGVSIAFTGEAGPTIGLLKPYYLKIYHEHDGVPELHTEKYTEENKADFLDLEHIEGRASFFKGITELKIAPGLHGRAAVKFDVGAFEKYAKSLEAGILVDVYFKELPLMIVDRNKFFFANVYLTLQFGRRK